MHATYHKGVTIVELLIIFAVLGVLLLVVAPQFSAMKQRVVLNSTTEEVLSALDKARARTLASEDSSEYGVRFESTQLVIFKGTIYSALSAENEVIALTAPATITNVTLNGASGAIGELYFNRIYGSPSKSGTVIISVESLSKTITINPVGITSSN